MILRRTVAVALMSLLAFAWTPLVSAAGKSTSKPKPKNAVQARSGIIGSIDEKGVTLRDKKGKETSFVFTPTTKFVTASPNANPTAAPATYAQFKPGNHVKITFTKAEGGDLVVKQIAAIVTHSKHPTNSAPLTKR